MKILISTAAIAALFATAAIAQPPAAPTAPAAGAPAPGGPGGPGGGGRGPGGPGGGGPRPPAGPPVPRVLLRIPAKNPAPLTVTTPAYANMAPIPVANTLYGTNTFPGLTWTAGPAGTQSYIVIMEDNGAPGAAPAGGELTLHYSLYNIPAATHSLPAGMTPDHLPAGSCNGPNVSRTNSNFTGSGAANHEYHLQVFAMDNKLTVADPLQFTRPQLMEMMTGHVLASGEVTGVSPSYAGLTLNRPTAPTEPRTATCGK